VTAGLAPLTVDVGDVTRHALVSDPPMAGRRPVVVMFHGAGATAQIAADQTRFASLGAREGFVAVFPEGTARDPDAPAQFRLNPQTWNDGSGRGHVARRGVDDVAFTAALLERLVQAGRADRSRLFLTGFSNGGSVAFRAAAALSGHVAAVAPVAGHCWIEPVLERPVPLLYLMGGADPLNPLAGGDVATPWGGREMHPAVDSSSARWARANGCRSAPQVLTDGDLEWSEYPGCGATVRRCIIGGLGHVWPGGPRLLPERLVGRRSDALDGSEAVWAFFAAAAGRTA